MKFFMSIAVCSFLDATCMPYIQYPTAFDSWNTCMNNAYRESMQIISEINPDVVERNRLATKFTCEQAHGA
jgi:hypothetical protein